MGGRALSAASALELEADQVGQGAGRAGDGVDALVPDVGDGGGQVEDGAVGRADLREESRGGRLSERARDERERREAALSPARPARPNPLLSNTLTGSSNGSHVSAQCVKGSVLWEGGGPPAFRGRPAASRLKPPPSAAHSDAVW